MNRFKLIFQTSFFLTFLCLLLSVGVFIGSVVGRKYINDYNKDNVAITNCSGEKYCSSIRSLFITSLFLIGFVFIYKFYYIILINRFDESKINMKHTNIICAILLVIAFILLLSTIFFISFSDKNSFFNEVNMHTAIITTSNPEKEHIFEHKYEYKPGFYCLIIIMILCFIAFLNESLGCLICKLKR